MVIDLRTYAEAAARPVPSDVILNVPKPPLSPLQIARVAAALSCVVSALPKDAPIRVFCAKGLRSALATAILRQAGYTNVADLGGAP